MRSPCLSLFALAACCTLTGAASAQQIVHALSGSLVKIDGQNKTLEINTNDGSEGAFTFSSSSTIDVDFDRDVKAHAAPIASFQKPADAPAEQVVVFFYGNGSERTAVAMQDLGSGPMDIVDGTVTKFDRHQRTLTLKTSAGKNQTFQLDPKAVADTMNGAVPGIRFSPDKGDNVRVVASKGAGNETALFVRD